jgi:hypothetical protein
MIQTFKRPYGNENLKSIRALLSDSLIIICCCPKATAFILNDSKRSIGCHNNFLCNPVNTLRKLKEFNKSIKSSLTLNGKGSTGQITVRLTSPSHPCITGDSLPEIVSNNPNVAVGERVHSTWNTQFFGGYVTITAVGNGTCTITVKTASGPSASCKVTVTGAGDSTNTTSSKTSSTKSTAGSTTTKSSSSTAKSSAGTSATKSSTGTAKSSTGSTVKSSTGTAGDTTPASQVLPGGTVVNNGASSETASAAQNAQNSNPSHPTVSMNDDSNAEAAGTESSGVTAGTVHQNNRTGSSNSTVVIFVLGCVGLALGIVAIVMYRRHNPKESAPEGLDGTDLDETAELDASKIQKNEN